MADNEISGFISSSAWADWDKINLQADNFSKKLAEINVLAKDAANSISQAKGFNELNKAMQSANQQSVLFVANSKLYTQSMEQAATVLAQYDKSSKDFTQTAKGLADVTLTEAKAQTEYGKQVVNAQKYLVLLTKEKERQEALAQKAINDLNKQQSAYAVLNKQYQEAAKRAKDLAAAHGVENDAAKAAAAEALTLNNRLKEIDASIGNYQRSVGNYQQATFAMSQIIREAPAFANSVSTGLSAISNNIPIFIDEFKRLNEATGNVGTSIAILGKSFFSFTNIAVLAFTAFQFWRQGAFNFGKSVEKLTPEMRKFTDSLKEANKEMFAGVADEQAKMYSLLAIAKDVTVSYDTRLRAVKDLQDMYPAYLGNVSKEKILYGETAAEVGKLNEALLSKAFAQAAEKRVAASAELLLTYKGRIKEIDDLIARNAEKAKAQYGVAPAVSGNKFAFAEIIAERAKLEKQVGKTTEQQKQYLDDAAFYASQAAGLIVSNADKAAKAQDLTNEKLKAQTDLIKQQAEEYKAARQTYADGQKAIADDENANFTDRLDAYSKYMAAKFDVTDAGYAAEYRIAQITLAKIAEIERKSIKDRTKEEAALVLKKQVTLEQLGALEAKALENRNRNEGETVTGLKKLYDEYAQAQLEGVNRVAEAINTEERGALEGLKAEYEKGAINFKAYEAKKEVIAREYSSKRLKAEVSYLQDTIQEMQKAGIDTTELNKILVDTTKQLYEEDLKNFEDKERRKKQIVEEAKQNFINAVITGANAAKAFYDNEANNRLAAIQAQQDAANEQYSNDKKNIENSTADEQTKQEKLAKLEAKKIEDERKYDRERARINRNKAIADRTNALFQIGIATAVSLAQAQSLLITNPFLYPFILGSILANAAAQTAAVFAQQLPAYAEGTENHPGGLALYGEAGPELVREPGKAAFIADKPTISNLSAGTKVTPLSKLDYADLSQLYMEGNIKALRALQNHKANSGLDMNALAQLINDSRGGDVTIHFEGEQFHKVVRSKSQRTTYLNKRLGNI